MKRVFRSLPRDQTGSSKGPGPVTGFGSRLVGCFRWIVLHPAYLVLAWIRGGPGIRVHLRIVRSALTLIPDRASLPSRFVPNLVLAPLDSVRYFEFAFALENLYGAGSIRRYLDVSSPRMFPILVLRTLKSVHADLVNPDLEDLRLTSRLLDLMDLSARSRLHAVTVASVPFAPESFDLITSLSVLEHIPSPGDRDALLALWRLLRPGGRLVVTVPCAPKAFEEYLNINEYGLLSADENGFTFGQRFYDDDLLRSTFFGPLGPPARAAIFGEKVAGTFFDSRFEKAQGTGRTWREPYTVATSYRLFESARNLPGIGVIAMEFLRTA